MDSDSITPEEKQVAREITKALAMQAEAKARLQIAKKMMKLAKQTVWTTRQVEEWGILERKLHCLARFGC